MADPDLEALRRQVHGSQRVAPQRSGDFGKKVAKFFRAVGSIIGLLSCGWIGLQQYGILGMILGAILGFLGGAIVGYIIGWLLLIAVGLLLPIGLLVLLATIIKSCAS